MRTVIIIGASSGIGERLAIHYAQTGCMVGIAARREELLIKIANNYPDRIIYEIMDVTQTGDDGAVHSFMKLIERMAGVDLVIYCSGMGEQNTMLDISKELNTVRVNVEGFMIIATAVFDYFLKNGALTLGVEPQFVTISSIASVKGIGRAASYSASKRFQVTYMEGLAQLACAKGLKITFTTILPGFIDTDFIKGRRYPMTMPLNYAVKCIINGIEQGCFYKIIDWRWAIVVFLWKLVPGYFWRRIKL